MEIQWSLVLFTVIAGAGGWLFSTSMIGALAKKNPLPDKRESIMSFVLLVVGGLASVTHLKHVDRIMEALNRPTSGIFVEAAFVGVLCVLIAIYFIMILRKSPERWRRIVGIVTMVAGIAFAYACGASYRMEARELWMTYALPLSYCATAGIAGAGLNLLLKALPGKGADGEAVEADAAAVNFAGLLTLVVSVISLVLAAAFILPAGATVVADGAALAWTVVTFAAIVVAGVLGYLAWKKPAGVPVAVAAVAAGFVAAIGVRIVMWLIGTPLLDFFLMPLE